MKAKDFPASVNVTYRWEKDSPVLRKFVEVKNLDDKPHRLLNVRLGTYRTDAKTSDGEQGFPVYLNGEFFMSLAHPSGWAIGDGGACGCGTIRALGSRPARHSPAWRPCWAFRRPARRGSSSSITSAAECGAWFAGTSALTAFSAISAPGRCTAARTSAAGSPGTVKKAHLHSLDRLAESQKVTGRIYDYCDIEFWFDLASEMDRFSPVDFPHGFAPIQKKLDELGIKPGLWTASAPSPWSTLNPKFAGCCIAQEPFRSGIIKAYRDHIRNEGVGMCKFDCLSAICNNPAHNHLPCVYSTEAMHNAVLELLRALDGEDHAVFLMLYWGYRSPWWLLDADTVFEPGVFLEAAHPGGTPTLYARDSVTQGLDQAHYYCEDVPAARQGFAGHLALRLVVEQFDRQAALAAGFRHGHGPRKSAAADLGRLGLALAARVGRDGHVVQTRQGTTPCFDNSRFILGNPWKNEPYGYCCSDGRRAFFCLNNCTWNDRMLSLQLDSAWGLPDGVNWDLYRWYPRPAHLIAAESPLAGRVDLAMRPFEVVLLEAVPKGEKPSLDRPFADQPLPRAFSEPSRRLEVKVLPARQPAANRPAKFASEGKSRQRPQAACWSWRWNFARTVMPGRRGTPAEFHRGGVRRRPLGFSSARAGQPDVRSPLASVADSGCAAAHEPRDFELSIRSRLPADVSREFSVYFLPE